MAECWNSSSVPPILSVQELAKEPLTAVPQPFLLDDRPSLDHLSNKSSLPIVPTIDMNHLIMAETADSELQNLHSSCKEWGAFQVFLRDI